MKNAKKQGYIKKLDLFKNLSENEIDKISYLARDIEYPKKHTFIFQEDDVDGVYILVEGSVKVFRTNENGKDINLSLKSRGDIIGEMAALEGDVRSASVETLEKSILLKFSKRDFDNLLKKYPSVAKNLLKILSKRLREAGSQYEETLSLPLKERVQKVLITLSGKVGSKEIVISHQDLASIVGATRPRVSEELGELEREKKIALLHKKIILK